MKYWQKCLESFRNNLSQQIARGENSSSVANASKGDDPVQLFVDYSILAGDYDAAAITLEKNKQTKAAKTVKFVQLAGGFPATKVAERHRAVNI